MAGTARTGTDLRLGPGVSFEIPTFLQGSSTGAILPCFPRHFSTELDGSWNSTCRDHGQKLSLLLQNAGHRRKIILIDWCTTQFSIISNVKKKFQESRQGKSWRGRFDSDLKGLGFSKVFPVSSSLIQFTTHFYRFSFKIRLGYLSNIENFIFNSEWV